MPEVRGLRLDPLIRRAASARAARGGSRSRASGRRPACRSWLADALKLSARTLRATIPTSSVVRAPIQSRPRVSRWTRPDSARPETATAVRPTASGHEPRGHRRAAPAGVAAARRGPGSAAGPRRGARAGPWDARGAPAPWRRRGGLRLPREPPSGPLASPPASAVPGRACAPPAGGPSASAGCARSPRGWPPGRGG